MSDKCHRALKLICALEDMTMSDYMYKCARAHIHGRARVDDQILHILHSQGIEVDPA